MPGPSPRWLIAGLPVVGDTPNTWSLTDGVAPFQAVLSLIPEHARSLLGGPGGPVKLKIRGPGKQTVIDKLYVIRRAPSPDPEHARVVVVDRRFWWQYVHVRRGYNIRRRVGTRTLRSPGAVVELDQIAETYKWAPWSLEDGKFPWTPKSALRDIFAEVLGVRDGSKGDLVLDPTIEARFDSLPLNNIEVDDRGDRAIARILSHFPDVGVTLTEEGKVLVYARADGSEERVSERAGPATVDGGHIEEIQLHRQRPSSICVHFQRELEVLFIGQEGKFTAETDGRWMENVLPVPDRSLELTDGRSVSRGTWITVPQALDAWNAQGGVPGHGPITLSTLQRGGLPFMDLWAGTRLAGYADPDNDWASRIATLRAHWRTTWRINRRWMDRLYSVRATRVATLDSIKGTRGRSQAYSDYAILPTMRSLLGQQAQGIDQTLAINVLGFPASGRLDDANVREAPCNVQVLDQDQGILRLDWSIDPSRAYEQVVPGQVEMTSAPSQPGARSPIPGPTADFTDKTRTIAFNSVTPALDEARLSSNYKVAVIVTVVPAAPNNDAQFHRVEIDPSLVDDLLPERIRGDVANSYGPALEVKVGPDVETARVAWVDDRSADIEAAVGISDAVPDLSDITINAGQDADGAGSLFAIARAVAAGVWAQLGNRLEGSKTVPLFSASLTGRLSRITHAVDSEGRLTTELEMAGKGPEIPLWSLLPDSTRRLVMRLGVSGRT